MSVRSAPQRKALISDIDNTMGPYVSGYLAPAITYAASCIASKFKLSIQDVVQILSTTMRSTDHDFPWLLEVSPLRKLFEGSDAEFVADVVRPFWTAWDTAVMDCYRPYPGVKRTFDQLRQRDKQIIAVTNAHDFCGVLRLLAAGLAPYLTSMVAIATPAPEGIDAMFANERRLAILAQCPELLKIALTPSEKKPDPTGTLQALQLEGLEPQESIFTGDAIELDGMAAARAGVPFVLINHGSILTTRHWDRLYGDRKSPSIRKYKNIPVLFAADRYEELLKLF